MEKRLEIPSLSPFGKPYKIVFEKQNDGCKNLPPDERKLFEELYDKIQEDPKKHCTTLEQLHQRQPQIPEIANLLTYAYLKLKKKKEAEVLIEKAYREHPDYLIARINFADQALRLGLKERIPEIFNSCFELSTLYPKRESFHYAEFRGFMTVMGFYHLEIGLKDKAEEYYQLAFQVDPLHPSVAALEKSLSKKPFLSRCGNALVNLARIFKKA